MSRLHIVLILLGLSISAAAPCMAQQKGESTCLSATVYENHNQIDYGPLKVRAVRGKGVVEVSDKSQPGRAVPGACLSLFTEKEHMFLASVVADPKGQFQFDAVPPGRYRLVARADAFCIANIPLEILRSSRKRAEILVHFRFTGIDTCSYGDLAVSRRDSATPTPTTHDSRGTTPGAPCLNGPTRDAVPFLPGPPPRPGCPSLLSMGTPGVYGPQ
jgi:hypothetical protein